MDPKSAVPVGNVVAGAPALPQATSGLGVVAGLVLHTISLRVKIRSLTARE